MIIKWGIVESQAMELDMKSSISLSIVKMCKKLWNYLSMEWYKLEWSNVINGAIQNSYSYNFHYLVTKYFDSFKFVGSEHNGLFKLIIDIGLGWANLIPYNGGCVNFMNYKKLFFTIVKFKLATSPVALGIKLSKSKDAS